MELLSLRTLLGFGLAFLVYLLGGAFYRLYWSPLAKIPGPKLAALTLWYEFYYDVIKRGRYTFEIGKMHQKYGPIVRISPHEIHVNDPEFIDKLYLGSSRRTNKYPWAVKMFGNGSSAFETVSHELHRVRRAAFASFLSKASVQRLEPVVQSVVEKLVSRLEAARGSGTTINALHLYSALTGDIINQYAFARSHNYLDRQEFAEASYKAWMHITANCHLLQHFGFMITLMRTAPDWLVQLMAPDLKELNDLQNQMKTHVIEVKNDLKEGRKIERTTVFHDILSNKNIRPQEKDTNHLATEAQTFIAAGTITTTHILSTLTYYILDNPQILQKLQSELQTVSQPTWQQLEALPYLNAIVLEGLRIGYGVTHRLQRELPDNALQYQDYTIPPNTPIGMTSVLIHNHETIFTDHGKFVPERWLQPSSSRLQKYLLTFGKGSRQCAGMNLAYCEIYLTLAAVFAPNRFKLELFETDISDVETPHDFFNPVHRSDSKGIRITVR